ncbi:Gfo/Idh/MocA family oxidoreductase [Kitasatospora cineracea]
MKVGLLPFAHTHALSYAALLRDMDGVELLIADPDGTDPEHLRGKELADHLGVAYALSYEDLFAWQPDAVVVCAENARHRELVELAARHGADMLCEKPHATTPEDARAMIDACAAAGVRLAVAHPARFGPAYAALRADARSGQRGRILAVRGANFGRLTDDTRAWFSDHELAGGGALMDHTVHVADLLDGTHATIDCSWSQPLHHPHWSDVELRVVGEKATVELTASGQLVSGYDEANRRSTVHAWSPDLDHALLSTFLHGPAEGAVDVPDGEAGLRALRIVTAGYAAARTGQPVPTGY